jgi:hypothetical protein
LDPGTWRLIRPALGVAPAAAQCRMQTKMLPYGDGMDHFQQNVLVTVIADKLLSPPSLAARPTRHGAAKDPALLFPSPSICWRLSRRAYNNSSLVPNVRSIYHVRRDLEKPRWAGGKHL